jgi:hypothetical protein
MTRSTRNQMLIRMLLGNDVYNLWSKQCFYHYGTDCVDVTSGGGLLRCETNVSRLVKIESWRFSAEFGSQEAGT